jgi:PAS domain S-box-containing protein
MVSAIPTDPEDFAGSLPSGLSTERALESIPDLVIILDEEGRYFWFNGSYQEILKKLGKTADEVRGRVPWDVLPGLTGTPFQIETERAVRKREYVQYTEHYEPLDTWFEVRIFPFSGGVLVWGRDVTDSIRTNRALSASETRARAVFEQAAVGMARVSTTGRWIEVNERFAAMLGYTQQELVSKTFADVTHPDERMRDLDAARRIVAGELDTYTVDKRYVRKDGSIMWARLTTTLVTEPEGEQVFLSVIEDISHRREVEDALQREERRYRALVDASAKMVWHTSAEGLFVERQPGWEAYTGQKFEEYRGTGWLDAIHPDDRESTGRRWMNAVAERATLEMEYRIRDREGVYRWFLVRAVPILDAEGRIGEWVGTETEIENYVRRRLGDRLLAHLGSLLAAGLEDVDAGLQEAARLIVGTKADRNVADGCMITLLDEGNARQVAIVSADPEIEARARDFFSRYPLADDAPNGYPAVLRTGKSELVQPHEMEAAVIPALSGTSDMLEAQRRLLVYSGLCVPLVARGRINGAMTWVLHGPDRRAAFDERTVELAEEIGRRLALAIENSRLTAAMRASNQELREVNERLQMQAVEMEAQAEELQVTAEELEERTEAADEMRREAEMARQQLVEVFTQAPVAVAVLDRRDLRLSLVNSRFSALFGDAAAVGRTLSESVHGGDNEVLVEGVSQVIETGRSWQLSEWRMAKGESEQIVDFTVEPLRSAAGRVIGAAIVANDVTTQVLAREASEESERLIRTLADAIPTLAWTAQADGFIDWYNARWYEYTGTTPEDMAGWGWQSVHDPEVLPEVLERWKASIATGAPFEMTFPLRGADGVFRQFLTRVSPLTDSEGSVIRWFGTNTDVEIERAALAAAERAVARTERLQLLTAELAGARTASDVARVMVAEAGRAIGASAGLLLLR